MPPTCRGVGGSPGGMVNHSGKLLLKITPEEWRYLHICVSPENDLLERRWGLAPESRSSLREWLCVEKLEMCCPQDHYGPKCQPCAVLGLGDKVRQDDSCLHILSNF